MKIKNRSCKRSHKLDGIGVGRIRTVPFSSDSAYDSDAYDPVKTRCRSRKQKEKNQPITMPGLFFGFRLRLRQSSFHWIRVINWNCFDSAYDYDFRFSLGRSAYNSDYGSDSDSVVSENQPLQSVRTIQTDKSFHPIHGVKPTVNILSPLNEMQFTDR